MGRGLFPGPPPPGEKNPPPPPLPGAIENKTAWAINMGSMCLALLPLGMNTE